MSAFNTLIKKLLIENRISFETSTLTEEEREYVDKLTKAFVGLFNACKDQLLNTIKAKQQSVDLKHKHSTAAPLIALLFREKFDSEFNILTKKHLEKVSSTAWNTQLNREFYTYLRNTFSSFIDEITFYVDPESTDDLCVLIIDTKYLTQYTGTTYSCKLPEDIKKKSIYYHSFLEKTIRESFTSCFLFCIKCVMRLIRPETHIPYFFSRSKALRKEIIKHHEDPSLENLLDF